MSRDLRFYLADVIERCDRIIEYTDGHDLDSFSADHRTVDAVAGNFEIIGEAVKSIPKEILALAPSANWSDVARFRDIIAHQYFRI